MSELKEQILLLYLFETLHMLAKTLMFAIGKLLYLGFADLMGAI